MAEREADDISAANAQAIPTCIAAWLVPGLGHFLRQKRVRGLLFMMVVTVMFGLGLYLEGELFPLDRTKPLTLLAALAEMGVGLPYFFAKFLGLGAGRVEAITYEYGYTFCIVAGLLNMLIVLDAYDISMGRKP